MCYHTGVMSAVQNIKAKRAQLVRWIDEIDRAVHEIALTGTSSASVSAGGGSKSYSRIDLAKLTQLRAEYAQRVAQLNRALVASSSPAGIRRVMTVRCGI